jgi:tRNA G18 (ribose-2'-O)-methylase SpoU
MHFLAQVRYDPSRTQGDIMAELEPHYANTPHEDRSPIARHPVHIVLDNIRSAFNVGSIFRTSDAGAVEHIHLCGMSAHPPHKKLEKTALGAFEYIPWTYYERTRDCLMTLKEQGIPIVGIEVAPNAVSLHDFRWPQPVAIVLGNEVDGINEKRLRQCDTIVKIPMHGYKNSINVATAFGIVLYDILAQRQIKD